MVGYTHPVYGQAGLEASLDSYLRGLRGNPGLTIWLDHLYYGQPPPGLDVRLSLDSDLQRTADQLLGGYTGALVLLNAQTGEILAMASHPTFDANQLEANWENLVKDPQSPLLNRAMQGAYPLSPGLADELRAGLPADDRLTIPVQERQITPLQMALAAAALSNGGLRPALHLALAVDTPRAGWVLLPPDGDPQQVLTQQVADRAARDLAAASESFWQSADCTEGVVQEARELCWFTAGTTPDWQGTPLALSILLERNDPGLAERIGQAMLMAAMQP